VISGGQAIERGSHEKLLAADGMYRKLWDDQSRTPHHAADQANDSDDDDDDDDGDDDEE
jgi:ATP-binding cassette, subfamily B, bacterial